MAERERDDELDDDVIGRAEDEDEELADEEEADEEDEDAIFDEGDEDIADEEATGEVGDEGGSPGDRVGVARSRIGSTRGSESTETLRRERKEGVATDRTNETGRPQRRNP